MCGENREGCGFYPVCGGSPPRVRGKRDSYRLPSCRPRITPACAGKTAKAHQRHGADADHPRVCGENIYAVVIDDEATGSPPRVRGKPEPKSIAELRQRITPACAGKTGCELKFEADAADHPRVCGENRRVYIVVRLHRGSPPRVRGKP